MTFKLNLAVRITIILAIMYSGFMSSNVYAKSSSQRWDKTSHILARVSHESGVPVEHLAGFVAVESMFNAKAKNTKYSTAEGHFGFIDRTWRVTLKSYGHKYGLSKRAKKTDPYANIAMGAEYLKENKRWLSTRLGRQVTFKDLYMANLVSPAGVIKLERARGHWSAAAALPKAAASNHSLFYYKNGSPLTVAAFKQRIYGKYLKQVTTYQYRARKAYDAYAGELRAEKQWKEYMTSVSASPTGCGNGGEIVTRSYLTYQLPIEEQRSRVIFDLTTYAINRRLA